ncbi:hypothetical protein VOI54_15090 [Tamlana sp. 2201CG12-4]|uniref:hypothetical protein n=1 Tax=Tamlana sp. 2201CG12-4 TaxID=3112582 RepID=UPI002DB9C974|nr:hypothetical protein [Tamlana sp. 2201CG12-4]MEC3908354.1 hypothetical protein [Tamlana sp. 2201CG12-4]
MKKLLIAFFLGLFLSISVYAVNEAPDCTKSTHVDFVWNGVYWNIVVFDVWRCR